MRVSGRCDRLVSGVSGDALLLPGMLGSDWRSDPPEHAGASQSRGALRHRFLGGGDAVCGANSEAFPAEEERRCVRRRHQDLHGRAWRSLHDTRARFVLLLILLLFH